MGSAIDGLWKTEEVKKGSTQEFLPTPLTGFVVEGELFHISPYSASTNNINFTSFPGKCTATLLSLMFWFRKTEHTVLKVDDSMEISPMDQRYYQITIQQKQALERQIKEGLAGVSTAITDFELVFHDLRKYRDFLNFFLKKEKAQKDKDKDSEMQAEQSLKAVFIDQVDVHTGEGVAMKLIAPRWPTIIADFMRIKDEDLDPKKIAIEYKVSEAEGVVLATKNKLYLEWRGTFEDVVKERYERLVAIVKARKFSIEEYKSMLKPYIERYKSIHETGEGKDAEGRSNLRKISWLRPGAMASSYDSATIWAFKVMTRPEPTRITYEAESGNENILKMPFCSSFKSVIRANIKNLKEKDLGELPLSPTGVEPLDKWVWALYKHIEDYYTKKTGQPVRFTLEELLKARNDFIKEWGDKPHLYFKCFDTDIDRFILRLPDGTELEDMTFGPIRFFVESQNMMLLRFLEIKAQENALENYINEMLGDVTKDKKYNELSAEYDKLFKTYSEEKQKKEEKEKKEKTEKEKKAEILAGKDLSATREALQQQVMREVGEVNRPFKLFKGGAYEPRFDDIITGPYFNDVGDSMGKVWTFLKAKFDVPGFSSPGVKI